MTAWSIFSLRGSGDRVQFLRPEFPDVLRNTVERKNFLPQVKAPHKLLTQ